MSNTMPAFVLFTYTNAPPVSEILFDGNGTVQINHLSLSGPSTTTNGLIIAQLPLQFIQLHHIFI